jgi:hypothetical protein
MTWTLENIGNYMKALASEARALKRKGWSDDDIHEFVARAAHVVMVECDDEMLDEVAYAMERAGLFEF